MIQVKNVTISDSQDNIEQVIGRSVMVLECPYVNDLDNVPTFSFNETEEFRQPIIKGAVYNSDEGGFDRIIVQKNNVCAGQDVRLLISDKFLDDKQIPRLGVERETVEIIDPVTMSGDYFNISSSDLPLGCFAIKSISIEFDTSGHSTPAGVGLTLRDSTQLKCFYSGGINVSSLSAGDRPRITFIDSGYSDADFQASQYTQAALVAMPGNLKIAGGNGSSPAQLNRQLFIEKIGFGAFQHLTLVLERL